MLNKFCFKSLYFNDFLSKIVSKFALILEVVQTSMSDLLSLLLYQEYIEASLTLLTLIFIFEVFLLFIVENLNLMLKIKLKIMFYSFILVFNYRTNNIAVPIFCTS